MITKESFDAKWCEEPSTGVQVSEIRQRYKKGGVSYRKLAAEYNVTYGVVHDLINRVTWKHVE